MIPRIDQTLEIKKNHYLDLLRWIHHKGGKTLYPERKICSRYFDNNNMQMYLDTVEGIIPRKKIRVRNSKNNSGVYTVTSINTNNLNEIIVNENLVDEESTNSIIIVEAKRYW